MAARYADRVAIVEQGSMTALGPTTDTLDPGRLSTVFATPIVKVNAGGVVAFFSPGDS
jgi:iron complex transport system ATP-binding protein